MTKEVPNFIHDDGSLTNVIGSDLSKERYVHAGAALSHLDNCFQIMISVRNIFSSNPEDNAREREQLETQALNRNSRFAGKALDNLTKQVEYLIDGLRVEEAKGNERPYTSTIRFLMSLTADVDVNSGRNIENIILEEDKRISQALATMLATRLVLTTPTREASNGDVFYEVNKGEAGVEIDPEKISICLAYCEISSYSQKGLSFRLSAQDDKKFRLRALGVFPELSDPTCDPVNVIIDAKQRETRVRNHLRILIGVAENAIDAYKLSIRNDQIGAALHANKAPYVNGSKAAYLRDKLQVSVDKYSRVTTSVASDFIDRIEQAEKDGGDVKAVVSDELKHIAGLSRLIRLEQTLKNSKKKKLGRKTTYSFATPKVDVEPVTKCLSVLGIESGTLMKKSASTKLILPASDAVRYEKACRQIALADDTTEQDPLKFLSDKFLSKPDMKKEPKPKREREKKPVAVVASGAGKKKPVKKKVSSAKENRAVDKLARQERERLEAEASAAKIEKARAAALLAEQKRQAEKQRQEIERLAAEEAARVELAQAEVIDAEPDHVETQTESVEVEKKSSDDELTRLRNELAETQRRLKEARGDKRVVEKSFTDLERKLHDFRAQAQQTEADLERALAQRAEQADSQKSAHRAARKDLEGARDSLQQKVRALEDQLGQQVTDSQDELIESRKQARQVEAGLRLQLQQAGEENTALTQSLADAERSAQEFQGAVMAEHLEEEIETSLLLWDYLRAAADPVKPAESVRESLLETVLKRDWTNLTPDKRNKMNAMVGHLATYQLKRAIAEPKVPLALVERLAGSGPC